ncbi:beta-3-deoxy-D-manno-oct-2-ulosonic acid transferase [Sphingomonas sp. Leaf33]|uniref:capsular polysaccharide export protein, LipB/KpsS family n=1 Tax=Sphingomonas sp. Leaf33 TaxID=1736215 RepID=UPI000A56BFC4|nr:beta-3-deoxy-D-manno-oct-2-ulosonic acid transferase [Sphingomonas sp. Leaf33]
MIQPDLPLLREPPFPWADATIARPAQDIPDLSTDPSPERIDTLFATIREGRVGGCFWGAPGAVPAGAVIVRTTDAIAGPPLPAGPVVRIADTAQTDPWSAIPQAAAVVAHGDDPWTAIATIAGVPVHLLSAGRFGTPGDDAPRLRIAVATDLLRASYRDPFTGEDSDVDASVATLALWRQVLDANRTIVAAVGFSWWKRSEIARFLWSPARRLRFLRSERRALTHAARTGGAVAVWPSRISPAMVADAARRGVPLVRVEDGFVRSVGLGSNFVPPSSVTVDRRGIHYDPSRSSDLEAMLAERDFSSALLARADRLRDTILAAGISKYGQDAPADAPARRPDGVRRVLVPGQVEDDMSVLLGGGGLASNLELLARVRALEPDAEIWFRPHPDVDAGHRTGTVRDDDALQHVDRVVRGGGMATLLDQVDAVHVLTSLTGFEALLRGREVVCHGLPFYAGWGLTRDLAPVPPRRGRTRTLEALIAAVLIAYPRYLDPVTGLPCPPEMLIRRMSDGSTFARDGWITRARRVQGWLLKGWR